MQKHSISLWLFMLIAGASCGPILAAEQTTAIVDVCHSTYKEKLKAKLAMLRAMQAPLAAYSNRKIAIAAPILGLGLATVIRIGGRILNFYVSEDWRYANTFTHYAMQFCPFTWFCRYNNEYADKLGLGIMLVPGVAAACYYVLASMCTSLENEIAQL